MWVLGTRSPEELLERQLVLEAFSALAIAVLPGLRIAFGIFGEEKWGMTALKTALFILLVPGFLLGVVPVFALPRLGGPALAPGWGPWLAVPLWAAGMAAVAWCAADFVRKGRGTPAPLDPPRELVVTGLYRFMRNPMYAGALLI